MTVKWWDTILKHQAFSIWTWNDGRLLNFIAMQNGHLDGHAWFIVSYAAWSSKSILKFTAFMMPKTTQNAHNAFFVLKNMGTWEPRIFIEHVHYMPKLNFLCALTEKEPLSLFSSIIDKQSYPAVLSIINLILQFFNFLFHNWSPLTSVRSSFNRMGLFVIVHAYNSPWPLLS